MALIYLDTRYLSCLSVAREKEPQRFSAFLDMWRSRSHTLAFTRAHLLEIRQHADPAVRRARYSLLEDFLPFLSDIDTMEGEFRPPPMLSTREIIAALIGKGRIGVGGPKVQEWVAAHITAFPSEFSSSDQVHALHVFENSLFGAITQLMKSAFESEAEAQRIKFGIDQSSPRLRDLPVEPLAATEAQAEIEEIERAVENMINGELSALLNHPALSEDDRRRAHAGAASVMDQIRSFLGSAEKHGIRQAYSDFLRLEDDPSRNRRRIDVLRRAALWEQQVTDVIRDVLGLGTEASSLSKAVTVEDCRGTWLAKNVGQEIEADDPDPDPSNGYDLEHLAYLPYVDRFFTDKRIAEYVRRVLSRKEVSEHLRGIRRAEAIPDGIDHLQKALFE